MKDMKGIAKHLGNFMLSMLLVMLAMLYLVEPPCTKTIRMPPRRARFYAKMSKKKTGIQSDKMMESSGQRRDEGG